MKYGEFRELVTRDFYRYYCRTTNYIWLYGLILGKPQFKLVFMYRLSQYTKGKPRLSKMVVTLIRKIQYRNNKVSLPREAKIGPGLCIFHPVNIRISGDCKIGLNFTVAHNVTLGWVNHGAKRGVPEIGNNVYIGPGALVLGKIKIGDNVLIAGNSFVTHDIPSNSLVYGNPCIVKPCENATEGYILNTLP